LSNNKEFGSKDASIRKGGDLLQTLFILGVGFALGGLFYMYINNKHTHKRKSYSRMSGEGFRYSNRPGEGGVTSEAIISQMQFLYKRDGKVVVEFVDDEEIRLTTLGTLKDELADEKLSDIKNLIKESL